MKIAFEIATCLLFFIAIMQKEKWKMMVVFAVNNVVCICLYFAYGRVATASLCIVALARTIIYGIYAYKKIKPNWIWLVIFESAYIVATALAWQDALDLLPLAAMLAAGYGSWQDNVVVLRSAYIINTGGYLIYKAIIGAYIAMTESAVSFVATIFSLIYYVLYKKDVDFFELIFSKLKRKPKVEENSAVAAASNEPIESTAENNGDNV